MDDGYPDEMRYWTTFAMGSGEKEYLRSNPLPLDAYLSGLDEIGQEYAAIDRSVAKSALILSALVYMEYYVKSTITGVLD